jgi:phenylalanyl-tRNA synthetase beta chain
MKVPISWLREYVDAPADPAELAKALVMAGVGIESVEGEVLDLEITANRADLLSLLGVAREVGVLRRLPVRAPEATFEEAGPAPSQDWAVEVAAPELCPRYTARVVRGVKVGPSPDWLSKRLEAAGVRPVNNVVDVTNYVLLETGQPLHAFDAKVLRGGKIVVRRAARGEKIAAIDGKTYELDPERLVIADAGRPVAVAGVMGGKESEIGPSTQDVVLESAQFDPVSVRRTSRRLGLSSDSSYRFERGVDYDGVEAASRRAVQLILQVAGGRAGKGALDVSAPRPSRPVARVRPARVSRVLGLDVPAARVREILAGLGCAVAGEDAALDVTAPAGRRDLRIEADYVEEVARIEGYERIPCDTGFGLRVAVDNPEDLVREELRSTLTGLGAYEALTWSFAEAGTPNRVGFWTSEPPIPLRDPQGQVDRTLRESLAPGLLQVLRTNESYKEELRPVFEIAHVYRPEGRGFGEKVVLGLAVPGGPLEAKGLLETALARLGAAVDLVPRAFPFLEAGSSGEVFVNGASVGYLGTPPAALADLRAKVAVAEVDFEALVRSARLARPYREFDRQPPVERDLSVVFEDGTAWARVEKTVRAAAPPTLESVSFASEYRGAGIPAGRKGWAFSMRFRAPDRTLTAAEVEAAVKSILNALERDLGARQR